ncbi:MAG: ABC transporter ATP-binding protein/permease [Lentisphaeraceae bacterium]|nr:ABC transporter ATP-binding protein/permease [Lentisphaeraceae bacterium]
MDIVIIIAFATSIGLLLLASPIAVQAIVNAVTFGGLIQPIVIITSLLALALGIAATLFCIQTWTVELLQQRIFVRLTADLTARVPKVKIEEYNSGHGPELVNRFFDILTIQKAAPKLLIDALGTILAIIVGLSVLAAYHPLLLIFDVFLIVVIAVILFLPLKRGQGTAISESSAKYEVAAWLEEIARVPRAFRTGETQQWIFDKSDELTTKWVKTRKSHFRVLFLQIISVQFLYVVASVILLGLGGWLVLKGSLSIGQLVAAELIVTGIVYSISKSGKHLETWYDLMAAVYKVGQLLDTPIHRTGGEQVVPSQESGSSLQFNNLSWKASRKDRAFKNINLSVEAGGKIGLHISNDIDKTILLDIIWGLREPTSGFIKLSGIDTRDLALNELRSEIAIVSTVEVINGSISENISLHRDSVTYEDILKAISFAGLTEVIDALPEGLNTILHPLGCLLSDDELRRLMLARALVGSPSVLAVDALFDHSLPHVRNSIFDNLFKKDNPWTLVIASDLPEVLERCNEVLELSNTDSSKTNQQTASGYNLEEES